MGFLDVGGGLAVDYDGSKSNTHASKNYNIQNYIIWIFSAYFAVTLVIKVFFVIIYLLQYNTVKRIKVKFMVDRNKIQYMKESKRIKETLQKFIDKMKENQIDDHV
jgi:arginine decarboxylase-like protein